MCKATFVLSVVLIIQPQPTEEIKGAREELKVVVMQCPEPFPLLPHQKVTFT